MTDAAAVSVDLAGHVATVEIHRPPHNWFDITVMTELADTILGLDEDPECHAVVLCSEGKNFCAGADPEGHEPPRRHHHALRTGGAPTSPIASRSSPRCRAPRSAGASASRSPPTSTFATPESRFSCNFAKLGFHQGFGISATLPTVVGQSGARSSSCTPRSTSAVKRRCASASPIDWCPPTNSAPPRTPSRRRSRPRRRSRCSRSARPCAAPSPTRSAATAA